MKKGLQYAAVWLAVKTLGALPRSMARRVAASATALAFVCLPRLRRVADTNLCIAFPELNASQRKIILRKMTRNLGWLAAEFAHFPRYTRKNIQEVLELDGHEHFWAALARGKGVLILTGHIGNWELSSFGHALYGYPLHYLARPLDNECIDQLIQQYRGLSGNQPINKNESARAVLNILAQQGTVGILADQNTLPAEGVFVNFFGKLACTSAGIARVALHTDAAVVPGYAVWDEQLRKYRLRFEPAVELIRTGDAERDILENTQRFTSILESIVRRYPDQWVWVHARWKTRPPGEPTLYS